MCTRGEGPLVADSVMSTAQRSRSGTSTVTARPPKEGCGCKPNKDGLCCATKACGCRKEGEECGPGCDCGGAFTEPAPLCDGHQLPCALVTTKEGANRGRRFFGCAKSRAESCGFFRWAQGQDAANGGCCARAMEELPGSAGNTADAAIDLSGDWLGAGGRGTGGGRGGGGRGGSSGGRGGGRGGGGGGGTGGGAARGQGKEPAAKKKPMRKGKKKRCDQGAGCVYKHEHQHMGEYFHSDDEEEPAAPPVCQTGLEPRNSRLQAGLLLTRVSLALGRAACRGSAAPADGAAPAGAAAARTAGARQAPALVSAELAAASAAAVASAAAAAAAVAAACHVRCAASPCPSVWRSSCTWRSTSGRATCSGCASSRRA